MNLTLILDTLNAEFGLACTMSFEILPGEAGRYMFDTGEIIINPELDNAEKMFTLFHEFRHAMQFAGNLFPFLYGVSDRVQAMALREKMTYDNYPEEIDANLFATEFAAAI